jgi:hypothetical protein
MLTMVRIVTGPNVPFKRKMAQRPHFGVMRYVAKGGFRS